MRHLLLIPALLALTGCQAVLGWLYPDHTIDAEAIAPLVGEVVDQMTESVERDPVLTPPEKEQAIIMGAELRALVTEALAQ